ncbi:DUF99 domain-containing protein [Methanosarcinales archaeon]|nr:MAG: DUF99 domain-containing protein [Methanosarcinales archaeon]
MNLNKKGIRVLGIAESFVRENPKSILAGIVMRSDMIIDGFALTRISVGGMDATEGVIRIFNSLDRSDINVIMLNGCVISWFNIIDLSRVYEDLGVPLVCVTYESSGGLEEHISRHFSGYDRDVRLDAYRRLGERVPVRVSRHEVLIRFLGMEKSEAARLLRKFTIHGKTPEPLRVARLVARAVLRN